MSLEKLLGNSRGIIRKALVSFGVVGVLVTGGYLGCHKSDDANKGAVETLMDMSEQDEKCSNSPLYGKYMWNVGNCNNNNSTFFDKKCEGTRVRHDVRRQIKYDGISIFNLDTKHPLNSVLLTRDISCSDSLNTFELCENVKCALLREPNLYILKWFGRDFQFPTDFVLIRETPQPNQNECEKSVRNEEWFTSCFGKLDLNDMATCPTVSLSSLEETAKTYFLMMHPYTREACSKEFLRMFSPSVVSSSPPIFRTSYYHFAVKGALPLFHNYKLLQVENGLKGEKKIKFQFISTDRLKNGVRQTENTLRLYVKKYGNEWKVESLDFYREPLKD